MRCWALVPSSFVALALGACSSESSDTVGSAGSSFAAGATGAMSNGQGGGAGTQAGSGGAQAWGGSAQGGSMTSGGSASGGTSSGGVPNLPCDDGFSFSPSQNLATGALTTVGFTHPEPLTYVDLQVTGPGQTDVAGGPITSSDPWTWTWDVAFHAEGVYTFTFRADETPRDYGSCQRFVTDTGSPPVGSGGSGAGGSSSSGGCAGKVCGDDDGNGGQCDTCPMEGQCLDNASPYGPGGPGPWECLDNAGCEADNRTCRIWCPFEPCDNDAHPDGCPQNTEACWVPANVTSYEEACKMCCESRHHAPTGEYACWDSSFSLCRYPTDCGLPLLNPP